VVMERRGPASIFCPRAPDPSYATTNENHINIKITHSVLSGLQPPVTPPQETRPPHTSTQSSFCAKNTPQKNEIMTLK